MKLIKAMKAARSGELTTAGTPDKLLTSLDDDKARVKTSEDWLLAILFRLVLDHCARPEGTLDSYERQANAEAMRLLADAGFIRVDEDVGGRVRATVLPKPTPFLHG